MESYHNISLAQAAAFLKLNLSKVSCGMFTGNWSCSVPFNRLIYIFDGSRIPSRISYGGKTFEMIPGNWLFVPAGTHTVHEQYDGLNLISLHFSLELITGVEYLQGCQGFYTGSSPERREEFLVLMNPDSGIREVVMLQKLIWEFVYPIVEQEKEHLQTQPDKLSAFQPLCDAFADSPYRDFSVEEMAKIMKMGKESFVKHFTARIGVSPKLFFHRIRSAAAAKELLATEDPVREIAERFHFSDEFYFSRFMKRMTGLSPREYRKRMSFPS